MTATLHTYLASLDPQQITRVVLQWSVFAKRKINSSRARSMLEPDELVNMTIDRLSRCDKKDTCPAEMPFDQFFALTIVRELANWIQREVRRRPEEPVEVDNHTPAYDAAGFRAWQAEANELTRRELDDRSQILVTALKAKRAGPKTIKFASLMPDVIQQRLSTSDIAAQIGATEENIHQIRTRLRVPAVSAAVRLLMAAENAPNDESSVNLSARNK